MLDTRPKENESLSWLWVGLWTMLILATIPLARAIASRLEDSAGTAVFLWLTAGTIVAALLVALRALARRQLALGAYIGLTVFGGALLGVAWHLRGNPVEAFHLVQYGILSVLIYRALLHRCSDNSIYLLSAVLTGSVGILDEWIQWLIPERYWGFRDVVINFTAAVLAQGLLASGLRPKLIRMAVGRQSATAVLRSRDISGDAVPQLCQYSRPDRLVCRADTRGQLPARQPEHDGGIRIPLRGP